MNDKQQDAVVDLNAGELALAMLLHSLEPDRRQAVIAEAYAQDVGQREGDDDEDGETESHG